MTTQSEIDARIEGWIACANLALDRIQTKGFRWAIAELHELRKIGEDCRFLMSEIKANRAAPASLNDTLLGTILAPVEPRQEPPPTRFRPRPPEIADWLLKWLTERESDVLPRMIDIARECPVTNTYYAIDATLRALRSKGFIAWRSGTRSENRGHSAIRVISTGRVLKTAGCPFDLEEASDG